MPTLYFPHLTPVQFYQDVPDTNPQYNSRLFDDWYFVNTILPWEQRTKFEQLWQTSDTIYIQLQSTYGPINLQVISEIDDAVINTLPFVQGLPNVNDPSLFIYEIAVPLNIYDPGCYYLKITFGDPIILTLRSEMINLSEVHENTLLLAFNHRKFYADIIWETGLTMQLRIPGTLKFKGPASKDTIYIDQVYNAQMIRSLPYKVWRLHIGAAEGIPDYLIEKILIALGCSNLLIDGKGYTKNEGAALEANEEEDYPMRGWTIELLPKINRLQRIFENDDEQDTFFAVMSNSDSKGFSTEEGADETIVIDVI